ncbi:MAG TPA: hypothetical protein VGV59_12280 [Pyrinomonadaceae bacterium]|nr:hypothetical protein [Pyrinomonadaceae bacterium]
MNDKDKDKGKGHDRRKIELLSELLGIMIPAESEITIEIKLSDVGGGSGSSTADTSTSRVVYAISKGDIRPVSSQISPQLQAAAIHHGQTLYW